MRKDTLENRTEFGTVDKEKILANIRENNLPPVSRIIGKGFDYLINSFEAVDQLADLLLESARRARNNEIGFVLAYVRNPEGLMLEINKSGIKYLSTSKSISNPIPISHIRNDPIISPVWDEVGSMSFGGYFCPQVQTVPSILEQNTTESSPMYMPKIASDDCIVGPTIQSRERVSSYVQRPTK